MFKVLVLLVGFVFYCGAAYAEDVENCLGFSFSPEETDARWRCSPIDTFVPIHHYFYLANSTLTTLSGFEFAWFADPPFEVQPVVTEVNVLGIEDYAGDHFNFVVRLDTPVPTANLMV